MTNWYCSREQAKKAVSIDGVDRDSVIDSHIASASREIDRLVSHRDGYFIPETKTEVYHWPQRDRRRTYVLHLDEDWISVSALTKEGDDATAVSASDYFLEPANFGPPYTRIEIDLSSTEFLTSKDTHQRAVRVTGLRGYAANTKTGGTVASGLAADSAATSMVCSNAALIDVGNTLLIESEQVFVSERTFAALGAILLNDDSVTASNTNTTITVDSSHGLSAGETILLDSEQMYIVSVSGNDLNVIRAYNGTTLAAHNDDTPIQVNRTLTIVRGVSGTTAATHANATAISVYTVPDDIQKLCIAMAVADYEMEKGGWTGAIGVGEGAVEARQTILGKRKAEVRNRYGRRLVGAV